MVQAGLNAIELRNFVKIARANEALMGDGAVALSLSGKFFLLKSRISCHSGLGVTPRKVEHRHVERMEAC